MYASAVIATLIAAVSALPHHPAGNTAVTGDICGNGNTAHCCNADTAGKLTNGGLVGDLSNLLGQCQNIPINVIGAVIPIGQDRCRQTAVCCGKASQNGLINLSCTNLNF